MDFNYHSKHGQIKITHLAFVDDLLLMSIGDSIFVSILIQTLKDFGYGLGLSINLVKFVIHMIGITGPKLEDIQTII